MDKSLFAAYVSKPEAARDASGSPSPFLQAILDKEASSVQLSLGYGSIEVPEPVDPDLGIPDSLPYSSESELEWSEPLSAMQQLLCYSPEMDTSSPGSSLPLDRSLDTILSREQADELLEIFALHYVPWLNFPLMRDPDGAVLEMVCCTVASRHLSHHFRSLVSARLQRLTDDTIAKLIFNSSLSQSLETIQALLILALWSPVESINSGMRDGRVMIASAVSIAMNMRLNEASAKVIQMEQSRAPEAHVTDLKNKARLWLALTNVESMLCLGTRRTPLTSRSSSDIGFIPHSALSPETVTECRDARLKLLGEMFNAVETSNKLQPADSSELERWYDAKMKVFGTMDNLSRSVLPLEVLADHDRFHFRMLTFQLHSCRLQMIHHAMYTIFDVFRRPDPPNPFWFVKEVAPHGIKVMPKWGKEILHLSEAVLISILQTDPRDLVSCPDTVFYMLAFAAYRAYATMCMVVRYFRAQLNGAENKLLRRAMQHLAASTPLKDHLASACARMISIMLSTMDTFIERAHAHDRLIPLSDISITGEGIHQPSAQTSQPLEMSHDSLLQDVEFLTQLFGFDPSDSMYSIQP